MSSYEPALVSRYMIVGEKNKKLTKKKKKKKKKKSVSNIDVSTKTQQKQVHKSVWSSRGPRSPYSLPSHVPQYKMHTLIVLRR